MILSCLATSIWTKEEYHNMAEFKPFMNLLVAEWGNGKVYAKMNSRCRSHFLKNIREWIKNWSPNSTINLSSCLMICLHWNMKPIGMEKDRCALKIVWWCSAPKLPWRRMKMVHSGGTCCRRTGELGEASRQIYNGEALHGLFPKPKGRNTAKDLNGPRLPSKHCPWWLLWSASSTDHHTVVGAVRVSSKI